LKEEALDRTLWRTQFGRGCGTDVGQTTGRVSASGECGSKLKERFLRRNVFKFRQAVYDI